jgi:3-oxoacyl-(acyl-carrier-protein) synthase
MPRAVAITGMGVVSAVGPHPGPFFEALLEGRSGVRAAGDLLGPDPSLFPARIAARAAREAGGALVADADLAAAAGIEAREVAALDRASLMAAAAARAAVRDAGLEGGDGMAGVPVVIGTGFGCIETSDQSFRAFHAGGPRAVKTFTIPRGMANAPAALAARLLRATGANVTLSTACASGTMAIADALRRIRDGEAPVALAGGTEAPVIPAVLGAWAAIRVVSRRNEDPAGACRPFARDRDGIVLAEGAAVLVLEDLEWARRRGARVHALVLGAGASCDADHVTAPSLEGERRAIEAALRDARIDAGAIDHVSAHGTATQRNDETEAAAILAVLGERGRKVPITATKSVLGHAIGASGALETAALALSVARGVVPPTANLADDDPACGLDVVRGRARPVPIRFALKTSFAFGGSNAALILGRVEP